MKKAPNPTDLLRDFERLENQERELQEKRRALAQRLIEAGLKLGGTIEPVAPQPPRKPKAAKKPKAPKVAKPAAPAPAPSRSAPHPRRGEGESWPDTLLRFINASEVGITFADLKAEVMKTPLGPILERTDSAFYGAITKLTRRELVHRHNGRVYSPAAFAKFQADVAAGRAVDEPQLVLSGQTSPLHVALLELLDAHPRGITTAGIVAALDRRPELNTTGKYSRNVIYNLISRLARREEIVRENSVCRKPDKDGAPNDGPLGAPQVSLLDNLEPKGRA